jgi:hypothetical protein
LIAKRKANCLGTGKLGIETSVAEIEGRKFLPIGRGSRSFRKMSFSS